MSELQNGTLVKHVSLGIGRVVAVEENAVHVFFPDSDKRFAAKLRLPAARAMLRTEGLEPNGWLEGLSGFSLDATTGRYALVATWMTHDQAVEQFLSIHPKGFAGMAAPAAGRAKEARPTRWRAAHDAWEKKLGAVEAARLISEDLIPTLVKRLLDVEKLIAPLHPPADVGALEAALSDEERARPFLVALVELLSVPSPSKARFETLFIAAQSLPVEPAQQWLVATLFPFIAMPERQVLMRPRATCLAADRLGSDIRYQATPNWASYSALRGLATQMLTRLEPEGAKDFIDVEAFLHVIATNRRPAAGAERARASAG